MNIFAWFFWLTQKRSFDQDKMSNSPQKADLSKDRRKITIIAWYLQLTCKRSFGYDKMYNYLKSADLSANGLKMRIFVC